MAVSPDLPQLEQASQDYRTFRASLQAVFDQRQIEIDQRFRDPHHEPTILIDTRTRPAPEPIQRFVDYLYRFRQTKIWRVEVGASYTEISTVGVGDCLTDYEQRLRGSIVRCNQENVFFDTRLIIEPAELLTRYQLKKRSIERYVEERQRRMIIHWDIERGTVPQTILLRLAELITNEPDNIQEVTDSGRISESRPKSLSSHLKNIP